MRFFAELGADLVRAWGRHDHDEQVFPALAAEALVARPPHRHASVDDLLAWVTTAVLLPRQHSVGAEPGQRALVVHWHPLFTIEALFAASGLPRVHDHGVAGAFAMLHGDALETEYTFAETRRVSSALRIGALTATAARRVSPGAARPIRPGPAGIRSLLLLDAGSVVVAVRTYPYREAGPALEYAAPHVAEDPSLGDDLLIKRVQMLAVARGQRSPHHAERAIAVVRSADFHTAYHVLRQELPAVEPWLREALVAAAVERHGTDMALAVVSIEHRGEQRRLLAQREGSTISAQRFALACRIAGAPTLAG